MEFPTIEPILRWLSWSLTFNRSSKDQNKFWMKFDSNETRMAPQIFKIRLRNMKFLGRAASDTDSRSQERNNIARIGRQHDTQDHPDFELTARWAFFLSANAVFTLSSRSSSCLEHPFSCRKWKGNSVSYETFLNTITIWIQHRQRAEPLLLHFQFYYLQ